MGDDGPVGSGVGIGVGVALGVGAAVIVGFGAGLATTFCRQLSLFPDILQIREPEVEFTFAHLAPNLATAPSEIAGIPKSRPATRTTEVLFILMGLLWQRWIEKEKMSGTCLKVWA